MNKKCGLHDQTTPKHKKDKGLGTAIFFLEPPKTKDEKMASIRNIAYADAVSRLARTAGFRWIPYSFRTHSQILRDDCAGTQCSNNCPGVCYCSGYTCYDS